MPEITLKSVRDEACISELATEVQGIISAGKEATIFLVFWRKFPLALKVYRLHRTPHRKGGKRKRLGGGKVGYSKDIMSYWAAREFWLLRRAFLGGVKVPTPVRQSDNMLTLQFVGEGLTPAPLLKDCKLEYPKRIFKTVIDQIFTLYRVFIIHGDLSAFNILLHDGEPWIIDFPQAIDFASRVGRYKVLEKSSPILMRDIQNIVNFFSRYGINADAKELYDECTSQIGPQDKFDPHYHKR